MEPNLQNLFSCILDIREYDVLYKSRVMIDKNIRCSFWYKVTFKDQFVHKLEVLENMNDRPEFVILAYDIECSKAPLKFPDAKVDCVMMISYMINGDGYLITNREFISEDIEDFEYAPNEAFKTSITVYNEPDEKSVLIKFLEHIKEVKPFIITTFNGDRFDFPFIEQRMIHHGINMEREIGIANKTEEYCGNFTIHMDCFAWVERDSYLPQGSHGLKAVTKAKLHYDPIEVDPEDMIIFAKERPHILCQYSVSDAVATYYLYMKHIHDFIFALCTIIPFGPDDVLRRGSGTLCENLLMAEAFLKNIIFPNKTIFAEEKFYNGHFLESETYIGGRVECMQNGVYRCDLDTEFNIDPKGFEELIKKTPDISKFFVTHELGKTVDEVLNFEQINSQIISNLSKFAYSDKSKLVSKPLIYHVDVAAMYPNIILTNRLQPVSIVNEKICSGCIYNNKENNCKRWMEWQWKGEYYPLNRGEFERIKLHHHTDPNMSKADDMLLLRKEVREYSQKHYKQAFEHKNEMRSDIVCMRENPFYVNTVKAFRDRRYEFKAKVKVWNKAYQKFKDDPDESKKAWNMMLLYESLQLAHKIILNSFYGYVMRRGARWYSMEMAAMVTHTGSEIIQMARNLFVKIGKPLELDTDGIWTLLPAGFPETFDIEFKDGSKSTLSFPCSMCNLLIYDAYKNTQYQMERPDKHMKFTTSTEMSIFFEIDGPHRAMVIPAAREENKVLKKRYAVFDMKGKLSEVKGFEIKRRGELKIIKIFQSEIFQQYLKGTTLRECYQYCAETCNKWLSILRQQGESMREDEIVTLIAESKVLSKNIKEYDSKKGVAITAAKRMSELLGSDLLNGKGLNCKFLISKKPANAPLNERVIPVALLHVKDEPIKMKFLRKWLKDPTIQSADIRPIIDWDYYIERVSNTIQKMVTISAAYQGIENPVPFIAHPKWLVQKLIRESDTNPQQKLLSFFSVKPKVTDIEDMLSVPDKENRQRPSNGMDIERNGSAKKGKLSQKKGFEEFEPTIQYQDNFSGWLEEQKKLWKLNRARRKAGLSSSSGLTRDNAAKSFFKNSELQLQNMPLHILSISKTKTPGEYIMWILFEHSPVSLKVKVERTIYIHVVNPKIDVPSEFKKSAKVLPRDKKVNALYEFTLPEAAFEQSKGTFENYLTNFEYEGIYETQVDLQFKMILKAGSYTKLGINARKDDQGFYGLKDFVYFGSTTADVINKNKLTFVYLFVVPFNENRLLVIVNEKINKVTLVYLHQNRVDESSIPKKAILNSLAKTGRKDEYTLEIINESNRKESMLQCLNKIIKGVEDSISKNFVYCGYGRDHLRDFFSHLEDTRPVIYLRTPDYSKYLQESSSINWYLKAVEHASTVILEMDSLLDERLTISRQLNIPAGNLPEAWETLATDVLYGRLLNKHNMVHWCSHRHYPDTGMGDVVKEPLLNLIETQLNYEDKTKLAYTTNYAIELSIDNFELAAIMKYEDIIKSDRELSIMVELGNDSSEASFSKLAFKAVRELMMQILSIKVKNKSAAFHNLLMNFLAWLSDKRSLYFDQLLLTMLSKIVLQLKRKLVQELKDRSIKVVSLTTTKIIIDSQKKTLQPAIDYFEYVSQVLSSIELFKEVSLAGSPRFWRFLMYQSPQKYIGLEHDQTVFEFCWKEIELLPAALKDQLLYHLSTFMVDLLDTFQNIIAQANEESGEMTEVEMLNYYPVFEAAIKNSFIDKTVPTILKSIEECKEKVRQYEAKQEMNAKSKTKMPTTPSLQSRRAESDYEDDEGDEEEGENDYDSGDSFIAEDDQDMGSIELKVTPKKKNKKKLQQEQEEINEMERPNIPGNKSLDKSPAFLYVDIILEFFNCVTFLNEEYIPFSNLANEALSRTSSPYSSAKEYLLTANLSTVTCTSCFNIFQLDLFKTYEPKTKMFHCPTCKNVISSYLVESKTVEWFNTMVAFLGVQDLQCVSSKETRTDVLSLFSDIGSEYADKKYPFKSEFEFEILARFRDLSQIAREAGMKNLAWLVDQSLKL